MWPKIYFPIEHNTKINVKQKNITVITDIKIKTRINHN